MRLVVAQVASTSNPDENLELVRASTYEAAEQGADLVVFPEATMCAFGRPLIEVAQERLGQWSSAVQDIALSADVMVIVGLFTRGAAGKVRNTLLATGPTGTWFYDKINLYDADLYRESDTVEAGTELTLFPLHSTTVGLATCYDLRFPGLFQQLARRGAELIIVPASWAPGANKENQWRTLVQARAMDTTAYLVACGRPATESDPTEAPGAPTGVGNSLVVDPRGTPVAGLGAGPGLLVTDIDPATVQQVRRTLPILECNDAWDTQVFRRASPDVARPLVD